MDRIDRAILRLLAADGRMAVSRLAERVGLSQSAATRRTQALESSGRIEGYSARLGYRALGFNVTALVDVTLASQGEEDLRRFESTVAGTEGVVECLLVSGEQDYRLKLLCRDLDEYDRVLREQLSRLPGVAKISSSFVLRTVQTRNEGETLFGA